MRSTLLFPLGLFAHPSTGINHHPSFNCKTSSNTTIISDAAISQIEYGAASELVTGAAFPWPEIMHYDHKRRVVTYCYSNEAIRDYLDCYVREAFRRWRRKLKSRPFRGTTNLAWQELRDGDKPRYCFDENRRWDRENVPGDTLWINVDHALGAGGRASVGYTQQKAVDHEGYHHLRLGPDVTVDAITHELGHVFGMVHEHQRHDRDEYVLYRCENLPNYPNTLARVTKDLNIPPSEAHKQLCEDWKVAQDYNFASVEFMKDPDGDIHDEPSVPFDLESIMMYSSGSWATPQCVQNIYLCPMLKYGTTDGKPDRNWLFFIETPTLPSDGDAKFVQKWYPRTL